MFLYTKPGTIGGVTNDPRSVYTLEKEWNPGHASETGEGS